MNLDNLLSLSFVGLMTVGFVNAVLLFKPDLDSRLKFIISLAFAFGLGYVPADIANALLSRLRDALTVAFAATGAYKLVQVSRQKIGA